MKSKEHAIYETPEVFEILKAYLNKRCRRLLDIIVAEDEILKQDLLKKHYPYACPTRISQILAPLIKTGMVIRTRVGQRQYKYKANISRIREIKSIVNQLQELL